MGIKNAKSQSCKHPSKPKPASSSSKSSQSNSVQKIDLPCGNSQAAAQLDANSIHPQSGILEGETGNRILEKEGIIEGTRGTDLPSESVELTAITLHQPWASLISLGKKHYETRSWATDYRGSIAIHAAKKLHEDESLISLLEIPASEIPLGAVVAIAQLTDCILMDQEFILKQSSFEQYLGLWEVGRYAWKLENVRAIEPIPTVGKQGLWKWKIDSESGKYDDGELEKASQVLALRKRFLELFFVHKDASAISKSDELEPWNHADFGELHHVPEADGQLNLLNWSDKEPPEPDDYSSLELFDEAYKQWVDAQTDEAEEELANFGAEELKSNQLKAWIQSEKGKAKAAEFGVTICNQSKDWEESKAKELKIGDRVVENLNNPEWGKTLDYLIKYGEVISDIYPGKYEPLTLVDIRWDDGKVGAAQVRFLEKVCDQLMDGSTCVQELEPASPMPESNCGEKAPTSSASGTTTASQSSDDDSPTVNDLVISKPWILGEVNSEAEELASSQQALPASPSAMTEIDSLPKTIETVSPQSLPPSINCNPNLQSSKTLPACSTAQNDQEAANFISLESLTNFPRAGTMSNGRLSALPTLERLGVGKDYLLLRSPGALSSTGAGRPPGKNKLDYQLMNLGLLTNLEVTAPEFLEFSYNLPLGFSNPAETRTALELSQVQAQLSSNLELQAETEPTAIVESPSATPCIGQLPPSDSKELNISPTLPALDNIGSFSKDDLLNFAITAHELIAGIERSELELAMRKLNQARIAGTCLAEYKKKCRYGEFRESVSKAKISIRTAQTYMSIAENWNLLLSEASRETLLVDGQVLGINWARDTIAQRKKSLKSAAAPANPDDWRTPNTKEQPIVDLIKQALGGQIWCDPCADAGHRVGAAVAYHKNDDGLKDINVWRKTVFINPPFSDPLPWVKKCCFSIARGDCSAAIMLMKAGTLSNQGTGNLIEKYASAVCHWRGRINFLNDEGVAVKGSDFDCVLVYFGDRLDLFKKAFEQRGTITTIQNRYSSVNNKHIAAATVPLVEEAQEVPAVPTAITSVKQEQELMQKELGLRTNGKTLLPDVAVNDRAKAEQLDPYTVDDRPFAIQVESVEADDSKWYEETAIGVVSRTEGFTTNQSAEIINKLLKADFKRRIKATLTKLSKEELADLLRYCDQELDNRK
jgi:hypothetical protein